jgi:tRNA (guanine37-N1)-methyltransferase
MIFNILTIFPGFFESPFSHSIIKRALERKIIEINIFNLRDYTIDIHRTVDDSPYGGGSGMVMKPEPFFLAYDHMLAKGIINRSTRIVFFTPKGNPLQQDTVNTFINEKDLLFICGRYEGIDQRVIDALVTDEISLGDYVISGGETATMVFIEAVTRLLPGAIGQEESFINDSFFSGLLDYPHYTRPPEYRNMKVPDVLLSGNHKKIDEWRKKKALELTRKRRPDLIDKVEE